MVSEWQPVYECLIYFTEQLNTKEAMIWTGLNQLDETAGWQWSDGAPLALVNWLMGITWIYYSTVMSAYCN